jgi:hypothetical protein
MNGILSAKSTSLWIIFERRAYPSEVGQATDKFGD